MSEVQREKTRILLGDDHHMVRQGIRQLLVCESDFEVIGETDNGLEAVRLACVLKPDIIILEARMPGLNSAEITKQVKAENPQTAVLILATYDDEEQILELLGAGAGGYLLKSASMNELVQAVRSVRAGEFVCPLPLAQRLLKYASRRTIKVTAAEHLTPRELEVLKLTARGMSNRDIAAELGIGPRTVKHHLMSVFGKMNVSSRTEAVLKAVRNGWITLEHDS